MGASRTRLMRAALEKAVRRRTAAFSTLPVFDPVARMFLSDTDMLVVAAGHALPG